MGQLIRLPDGRSVYVEPMPLGYDSLPQVMPPPQAYPPIYQQPEYQQPARWEQASPPRRARRQRRSGQLVHPVVTLVALGILGFCACALHPLCTFLIWGGAVIHLAKEYMSLERRR